MEKDCDDNEQGSDARLGTGRDEKTGGGEETDTQREACPGPSFTILKGADNYFHWNPERTEIFNFPTTQEGN